MRGESPSETDMDWAIGSDEMMDPDRPIPTAKGVLTSAEIEALLRPDLSDMPGEADVDPQSVEARKIPALPTTEEKAARELRLQAGQMAARLSLTLGQCSGVKAAVGLQSAERLNDAGLRGQIPAGQGAALCFGARDQTVCAMILLPGRLADAIIAKACGAPPAVMDTGRVGDGWTLSAIDCALLEQLLAPLGEAVQRELRLIAIETDMAYVASLMTGEALVRSEFTVEAPGLDTTMTVITSLISGHSAKPDIVPSALPVTAMLTARIASLNVPLSKITALKAGSTLLLGLPTDQPVEVLSGGRDGPVVLEGDIGRKGNNIAVKITGMNRSLIKDQGSDR